MNEEEEFRLAQLHTLAAVGREVNPRYLSQSMTAAIQADSVENVRRVIAIDPEFAGDWIPRFGIRDAVTNDACEVMHHVFNSYAANDTNHAKFVFFAKSARMFELLVTERGCNPNERSIRTHDTDGEGVTPIFCLRNDIPMAVTMLRLGARLDVTNKKGMTPISYLLRKHKNENLAIVRYLIEWELPLDMKLPKARGKEVHASGHALMKEFFDRRWTCRRCIDAWTILAKRLLAAGQQAFCKDVAQMVAREMWALRRRWTTTHDSPLARSASGESPTQK